MSNLLRMLWLSIITVTATAAASAHSLYVAKLNSWPELHTYAYYGDSQYPLGTWPGATPTETVTINGEVFYRFEFPEEHNGQTVTLIFNNGGSGDTEKKVEKGLQITLNGDHYYAVNESDNYLAETTDPETPAIYIEDATGWGGAFALYSWANSGYSDTNLFGSWPGTAASTKVMVGGHLYNKFAYPTAMQNQASCSFNLIVNNNNGGQQLQDYNITSTTVSHYITAGSNTQQAPTVDPYYTVTVKGADLLGGIDHTMIYGFGVTNEGEDPYREIFGPWPGAKLSAAEAEGELKIRAPRDLRGLKYTFILTRDGDPGTKIEYVYDNATSERQYTETVSNDITIELPKNVAKMPLTEADFMGDTPHYFLVGTRTADWRLQPEWELTKNDDGTFTLPGRVLYTGMMGIARVDTYNDYIHQRFTIFGKKADITRQENNTTYSVNELTNIGRKRALDISEGSNTLYNADNTIYFKYFGESDLQASSGVYAKSIKLSLNDNRDPSELTMEIDDVAEAGKDVVPTMVFQLVGDMIANSDWRNDTGTATDLKHVTPRGNGTTMEQSGRVGWQEEWIQYAPDNTPYYDGNGQYLYQTVFQSDWLNLHPSNFNIAVYNQWMPFTSRAITLVNTDDFTAERAAADPYMAYYEAMKKQTKINPDGGVITGGEEGGMQWNFKTSFREGSNAENTDKNNTYSIADGQEWEVYVAENVWIDGAFKIWNGWGGSTMKFENVDVTSGNTNARWYGGNGGPNTNLAGLKGSDVNLNGGDFEMYPTFRDSGTEGNWSVRSEFSDAAPANLQFFNRVILWYDPVLGLHNSVLQLITEDASPQILATVDDASQGLIEYKREINLTNEASSETITDYTITLYQVINGDVVPVKVV